LPVTKIRSPIRAPRRVTTRVRRLAHQRQRRHDAALVVGNVAADDRDAVPATDRGQPAIKLFQPSELHSGVEGECHDRRAWPASHGGDVAQVALEELLASGAGCDGIVEMLAVDDRIDRDQLSRAAARQHGAIVADAKRRAGRGGPEPAADRRDHPRLAEGGDGFPEISGERVHGLNWPSSGRSG
jgi:hypothetical protein